MHLTMTGRVKLLEPSLILYDGVMVKKEGKALVGNKFSGKDFWDDW